ncbi:sodium:proton antiporter [Zobellia amurskyensis]|uniref:Sodium:proton antiporter n=1 Tax=Zobellia amurskyensis TaxID=248905 RepID=A0A7X2ZWQ1_9FLAO|nr:sodium:proton antiporter [Zobellia amurskyensis]
MAFLPLVLSRIKVSFTVPLLLIGFIIYYIGVPINWPSPIWNHKYVKTITEIIVIISLMGAGLKLGMRYSLAHWKNSLRLIVITMPFYILFLFLICHYLLGFDGASSLLIAAVCAPTDPVLAAEIQLKKDEMYDKRNTGMRYLLTSEAGLNDGMAFPFVYLAILWSQSTSFNNVDLTYWFGYYMVFKICGGIIIGSLLGFAFSYFIRNLKSLQKNKVLSGFVGIGLAFLSFSLAELLDTYGFLSTFFTGLFAQYHFHKKLKQTDETSRINSNEDKQEILLFNEKLEEFLIMVWTVLFGGFVASGILNFATWQGVVTALVTIIIIRPITGRIALMGTPFTESKKWAISSFGIKGVGSFFYLAFALHEGDFLSINEIYAFVSYVVVFSILIHGLTAPSVISYFKKTNPG